MVGINRARDVSFTARKIDAETAHFWGLVSQLFESKGELLEAALRTAKMISRNDAKLVENYKKVLITGYGMSYQDARELETKTAWQYYREMPMDHFDKLAQFIKSRQLQRGGKGKRIAPKL
jgi:enoyl-CoA hydratase/carnithine racemase